MATLYSNRLTKLNKKKMEKDLLFNWKNSIITQKVEKQNVACQILWKEGARMELEQVYQLLIYILCTELAIVTLVAIALFVVLLATIRKSDNNKNTSLLDR